MYLGERDAAEDKSSLQSIVFYHKNQISYAKLVQYVYNAVCSIDKIFVNSQSRRLTEADHCRH